MNRTAFQHKSNGRKEWRFRPRVPGSVRSSLGGYSPLLAQLLYNRGVTDSQQAFAFLSTETVSHDPFQLPGMETAVHRLRQALDHGERIAIFGDFDVDGVSATALLSRALRSLGSEAIAYIPHRVDEGHGLSLRAVAALARQNVGLLVTVDCGVTSHGEIDAAAKAGMDTIVTDHHLPDSELPNACAVVDHQLPGSVYPFPHLTGAGLALKLVQAMCASAGKDVTQLGQPLLSLATLGTIADVAPILGENRSIVRQGLRELGHAPAIGLRALMRSSRLEGQSVDAEDVAWRLAPRLNASGRMDHAMVSYRLLATESEEDAASLASTLEQQNRDRQDQTQVAQRQAKGMVELEPLLMVSDPSFSPGIIGLVAARLVDEFSRPAVVVSEGLEISRGSCRSTPDFNIGSALQQVAPGVGGFVAYGGHPRAAGFTVETSRLPALRKALVALAGDVVGDDPPPPALDIDAELPLGSLPRDVYGEIQRLAPFGAQASAPVFLSRNVQVAWVRPMGATGNHLRLQLRDGGVTWSAVAFGQGANFPGGAGALDVVYSVEIDRWGATETLRLRVLDMRAAG